MYMFLDGSTTKKVKDLLGELDKALPTEMQSERDSIRKAIA